jgi:hypothetical protein
MRMVRGKERAMMTERDLDNAELTAPVSGRDAGSLWDRIFQYLWVSTLCATPSGILFLANVSTPDRRILMTAIIMAHVALWRAMK